MLKFVSIFLICGVIFIAADESRAAGKMMTRGEAVNACKKELNGLGKRARGALPSCVTAKLDSARAAGLHPQRVGRQCRYSTLRTSC